MNITNANKAKLAELESAADKLHKAAWNTNGRAAREVAFKAANKATRDLVEFSNAAYSK